MEGLTAWVSHYGIFLIAAAGAAALLCAFLARGKKLRWGAAAGALLCAAAAVWYFLPFSVPLDPQRTSVLLQFTLGEPLELTQEEREEVLRLCGELTYFRRPGQTVLRTGGTETAYLILLQGGDGGSSESLHLTLGFFPGGFRRGGRSLWGQPESGRSERTGALGGIPERAGGQVRNPPAE